MKHLFFYPLIASFLFIAFSCKYNDDPLWDSVNDLDNRVTNLEKFCNDINININSLQTIVQVIQSNGYAMNVTPVIESGVEVGYKISFSDNKSVIIYHGTSGKDGANGLTPNIGANCNWWIGNTDTGVKATSIISGGADGNNGTGGLTPNIGDNGNWWIGSTDTGVKASGTNGQNGIDGQDGTTPIIGVKKDTDGRWYWTQKIGTTDVTWILDEDGNKIEVNKNNEDVPITGSFPTIGINQDGNWTIDYGNGAEEILDTTGNPIKAQGDKGDKGDSGDSGNSGNTIFQNITQDNKYVYFTLSDGTIIYIPKYDEKIIDFVDPHVKTICLLYWDEDKDGELSKIEAAKVKTIDGVFNGKDIFAFSELKYFTGLTSIGTEFSQSPNLAVISIPNSVTQIVSGAFSNLQNLISVTIGNGVQKIGNRAFYSCINLKDVIFEDNSSLTELGELDNDFIQHGGVFGRCLSLKNINLPDGLLRIGSGDFSGTSIASITIPSSINEIGIRAFTDCEVLTTMYFKSTLPPSISAQRGFFKDYNKVADGIPKGLTIYVPTNSVNAYKQTGGWSFYSSNIAGYSY